jgi:hypothetical protein
MDVISVIEENLYALQRLAWKFVIGYRVAIVSVEGSETSGVRETMCAWISSEYSVFGFGM